MTPVLERRYDRERPGVTEAAIERGESLLIAEYFAEQNLLDFWPCVRLLNRGRTGFDLMAGSRAHGLAHVDRALHRPSGDNGLNWQRFRKLLKLQGHGGGSKNRGSMPQCDRFFSIFSGILNRGGVSFGRPAKPSRDLQRCRDARQGDGFPLDCPSQGIS